MTGDNDDHRALSFTEREYARDSKLYMSDVALVEIILMTTLVITMMIMTMTMTSDDYDDYEDEGLAKCW